MATTKKLFRDLDLQKNQIKNIVIDNLSSVPSNPTTGLIYYNTTDNKLYAYDGSSFVDLFSASSGNTYVSSASFNTSDGVLTLTLSDASTVTVDLDGRFLQDLVSDTSPQLGGNLDLNNNTINGLGNININGNITSNLSNGNVFIGNASNISTTRALTLDDVTETSTKKILTNTEQTKLSYITATQSVDLDNQNKEQFLTVLNNTASDYSQGSAIYRNGVSSGNIIGSLMLADGTIDAHVFLGLANTDIIKGTSGEVITFGLLSGFDTSTFSVGDTLYLDPSNYGGLTATKPTGTNLAVAVAKVLTSSATGSVFVLNNKFDENATSGGGGGSSNADTLDNLDSTQFLRSDTSDILNVGRGDVYIENNATDYPSSDGAGLTIRSSSDPTTGNEGAVGSILAVRSSAGTSRLWVGQSETTTGSNDFKSNNGTFNGDLISTGEMYRNGSKQISARRMTNIMGNNSATAVFPNFDGVNIHDNNYFAYTTPSANNTSGLKVLKSGVYYVNYKVDIYDVNYANRLVALADFFVNGTNQEFLKSYCYVREKAYGMAGTLSAGYALSLSANQWLRIRITLAKAGASFNGNFAGIQVRDGCFFCEYKGT